MSFRFIFLSFFLIFGCSCQHYSIRAVSKYNPEQIKNTKIHIVSIQEAKGDPEDSIEDNNNNIQFEEVKDDLKASNIKSYFLKEFGKRFGSSEDVSGKDIFVSAKINKRVICEHSGYSRRRNRFYHQYGDIVLDLIGRFKDGGVVFKVSVDYDMASILSGNVRFLICDNETQIFKKINEKIIPLAVQYAGQNVAIDK